MGVIYKDAITGEVISSPSESTRAKAAGLPVAEIPPPQEAPEIPSLPENTEESQNK